MQSNDSSDGNRYERRKEETRQKIINAAINLFNRQGFDATTMEQIAEEADIARKTLYNHFSFKEAIIIEYLQRFVRERVPEIYSLIQEHTDTRSRLVAVLNRVTDWLISEKVPKDVFNIYLSYQMQKLLTSSVDEIQRTGAQNYLAQIIKLGQEAGEIRQDLSFDVLLSQADNIRVSVGIRWYTDPEQFSVQDYIAESVDLFLQGAIDKTSK
ncbi:transcriptional regulator, TetR family [Desulfofarcimen acetoxidans DSM 771]|jgi:AcrR family transcriptional regulator|uniref:Transcriptional regulator, TetR family n=1 Tax=Desulfofarcimen acetoxidans (strain ATCC 49208 / DSM 771 / KCTC 5769 / VKM B-1644 / 5575) TaxID=485916 RepID=C8W136_DESAS|nr:TetR/AcrR family transcriptional regulator [Desulfofarcimen acetoxidans]ACV63432.1 transcriptional regulator, TetR family [Desulfofarcimen acetoxidans DSM 771]